MRSRGKEKHLGIYFSASENRHEGNILSRLTVRYWSITCKIYVSCAHKKTSLWLLEIVGKIGKWVASQILIANFHSCCDPICYEEHHCVICRVFNKAADKAALWYEKAFQPEKLINFLSKDSFLLCCITYGKSAWRQKCSLWGKVVIKVFSSSCPCFHVLTFVLSWNLLLTALKWRETRNRKTRSGSCSKTVTVVWLEITVIWAVPLKITLHWKRWYLVRGLAFKEVNKIASGSSALSAEVGVFDIIMLS